MMAAAWLAVWLLAWAGDPAAAVLADDELALRPSGRVAVRVTPPAVPAQPGKPFPVSVEVTPRTGIRVYARDNPGYFPLTLEFEWPRGVRADAPRYPESEPYVYGPLKELVQVYQGPFRITQRVTIRPGSPSARAGSFSITGVLRYQSCDDRVCFPVESLPVRLAVTVRPAGGDSGSSK